ncbi:hypothetical protein L682_00055 [Aquipseudomonas alcaligenes OT 69]|nr:hypothetical protein L682_00055 [Pseudomonas alcaligenes OT 69]
MPMKFMKFIFVLSVLMGSQNIYAMGTSVEIEQQFEKDSLKKTQDYAGRVKKSVPAIKDYGYGMKLDVAKVIYSSPNVKYCGSVKKLLSYADSKGELHTIRYLAQGECINRR